MNGSFYAAETFMSYLGKISHYFQISCFCGFRLLEFSYIFQSYVIQQRKIFLVFPQNACMFVIIQGYNLYNVLSGLLDKHPHLISNRKYIFFVLCSHHIHPSQPF